MSKDTLYDETKAQLHQDRIKAIQSAETTRNAEIAEAEETIRRYRQSLMSKINEKYESACETAHLEYELARMAAAQLCVQVTESEK